MFGTKKPDAKDDKAAPSTPGAKGGNTTTGGSPTSTKTSTVATKNATSTATATSNGKAPATAMATSVPTSDALAQMKKKLKG